MNPVRTLRVADVAIDPRSGGADALYTYEASADTSVGQPFLVPLGNRTALGYVTSLYTTSENDLGFPAKNLKKLGAPVRGMGLPATIVSLARFVAEEYICSLPIALSAAIPPGTRDRLVSAWILEEAAEMPLTPLQAEVLRFMRESGGAILDRRGRRLPPATLRALRLLKAKGVVRQEHALDLGVEKKQAARLLRLSNDTEKIDSFLKGDGKRKPAQAITLMRLQTADNSWLTPAEVKGLAGVTDATISALIQAGLLELVGDGTPIARRPPIPNAYQQVAIDAIVTAVNEREPTGFLLYGVTGSGKTEVYLRAAAEALKAGRQVLYLVPEIALAVQGITRLRERFGEGVTLLHSDLATAERLRNWSSIRSGSSPIVLGARSALYAPLSNIGLIVVDEEHEASYKQEAAPRYHARTLAQFLARQHSCPVVFGSATPSIESFYEAENENLVLLTLPERAASAKLPTVFVEDLSQGYRSGKPSLLCELLSDKIEERLSKQEQAILFLNRRAYSPFIVCRDCGFRPLCVRCAISLSFHRKEGRLRCHHCGYSAAPPQKCPKCAGVRLAPLGIGTEKVEEAVAEMFPAARVARLDRDIAKKKGALEDVLTRFRGGEIDVLVGTQMVAKGLDFPNVTLVGVVAADLSLNIPDFRSSERTFQLLSQVAGRAGRGATAGEVVIQSFNPENRAIVSASTHEFIEFYEALIEERKEVGYPPFRKLVNIVFSGVSRSKVVAEAESASTLLRKVPGLEVLGPVDCALERLQGRWRRHILLKLQRDSKLDLTGLLGAWESDVQVVVDVDPYSIM